MKKLKLNHASAQLVLKAKNSTTWRLFDDKDLSVNDEVLLIDKVVPDDPQTWKVIGTGLIDSVIQKRLGDVTEIDMKEHGVYTSKKEMLASFQEYYGSGITEQTPLKIVHFNFSTTVPSDKAELLPKIEKAIVYADGGSRGNPGPSASGYVVLDENNTVLVERGVYLGITTNNQAEYTSLKLALEEAKSIGAREVAVYMDSLLVVNQMKGLFKVRNRDLWPIHDAIKQLCSNFEKVTFTQVPRELNKLADTAVNKALDKELGTHRVVT